MFMNLLNSYSDPNHPFIVTNEHSTNLIISFISPNKSTYLLKAIQHNINKKAHKTIKHLPSSYYLRLLLLKDYLP